MVPCIGFPMFKIRMPPTYEGIGLYVIIGISQHESLTNTKSDVFNTELDIFFINWDLAFFFLVG